MGGESEQFFKSLALNSMEPVVGTNKSGNVVYWNSGASELFGFSREEVTGQSFYTILKNIADSSSQPWLETYLDAETGAWVEEAIDGASAVKGVPLSPRVALHCVMDGNDVCYYCVFKTGKLNLESRIAKLNSELKEFAYIISHDLKAPLRAVTILSEWILSDYFEKFDEEGQERVKLLVGRAKKTQAMIDGVLQYSRIGRTGEDPEEVEVNQLVAALSEKIERIKGDTIVVKKKLPTITFDLMRLRQIFNNLFTNAVEATPESGEIRIDCQDHPDHWTFSVSDTGKGIEEKNLKSIFNIFQTLSSSENVEKQGVGLTLVKRIVEVAGGEIWVDSRVGKGSTFFFTVLK